MRSLLVTAAIIAAALAWGAAGAAASPSPRIMYDNSTGDPSGLWTRNLDGSNPQPWQAGAYEATWSTDGSKVAFVGAEIPECGEGAAPLYVENADQSGQTELAPSACDAHISPDGQQVVFSVSPDVVDVVSTAPGSTPVQILPPPTDAGCTAYSLNYEQFRACGNAEWPAWDGNGTIVFINGDEGDTSDGPDSGGLWTIPAGGGAPTEIAGTDDADGYVWINGLAGSPDGSTVAASGANWTSTSNTNEGIFSASGPSPIVLPPPTANSVQYIDPEFSPDGSMIVYSDYNGQQTPNTSQIYTVPAGGGTPTLISGSDTYDTFPTFAPPGSTGTISGTVLGGPDGKTPLSGVTVTIATTGGGTSTTATTASNGTYTATVDAGTYLVTPTGTPPGQEAGGQYDVNGCSGTTSSDKTACTVTVATGATANASFTYVVLKISGTVTLAPTKSSKGQPQPAPGIPVTITGPNTNTTVVTDGNGDYSATIAKQGTYSVTVTTYKSTVVKATTCTPGQVVDGKACQIDLGAAGGTADFQMQAFTLSGKVSKTELYAPGQPFPYPHVTLAYSGPEVGRVMTGDDGTYSVVLPAGHYKVHAIAVDSGVVAVGQDESKVDSCQTGDTDGDTCDADLSDSDGVADFTVGENITATFDPATVPGNGLGFSQLQIQVTGLDGQPLADRTITVAPVGDSNVGSNELGTGGAYAPDAIICTVDGQRISPIIKQDGDLGFPYEVVGKAQVSTNADGLATVAVFAGKSAPTVTGELYTSVQSGDVKIFASDERGSYDFASARAATLRVTPGATVFYPPFTASAPSPHLIASELAGRIDLRDASAAQIQTTMLQGLELLYNHDEFTDSFAPVVGHSGIDDLSASAGIGFGTAGIGYYPGQNVAGYMGPQIIDQHLATVMLSPNALDLPSELPTFIQWSKANLEPTELGANYGQIFEGHLSPVAADAITYFSFWPYPPANQQLSQLFDKCVPELGPPASIFANIFSPLHLEFIGPHGEKFGIGSDGKRQLGIPGGVMFGGEPATYIVPKGTYTLRVTGTGNGKGTVALYYPAHGTAPSTKVFTLQVRRGETGTLNINGSRPASTLRFGGRSYRAAAGLGLTVRGLPRSLRRGQRRTAEIAISDPARRPVVGATVTVAGRGFKAGGLTDQKGRARLRLKGTSGGLTVVISALGDQTLRLHIPVRKR